MADKKNKKKQLIEDFKALENKAKELYPDIEKTVSLANNMTAQTTDLQEYLNLTMQTPTETSTNQISI
jgi:hypothetical protein